MSEEIKSNLESVKESIVSACNKVGRDSSDITLIAVSKRQPIDRINAYLEICENPVLGENYVQEYRDKLPE